MVKFFKRGTTYHLGSIIDLPIYYQTNFPENRDYSLDYKMSLLFHIFEDCHVCIRDSMTKSLAVKCRHVHRDFINIKITNKNVCHPTFWTEQVYYSTVVWFLINWLNEFILYGLLKVWDSKPFNPYRFRRRVSVVKRTLFFFFDTKCIQSLWGEVVRFIYELGLES